MARSVSVASADSNWKTPAVRPSRSSSYTFGSSKAVSVRSGVVPCSAPIILSASWMTVRVLRPRMSIFSIPTFSSAPISYWVIITSSPPADWPAPLVGVVQTGT